MQYGNFLGDLFQGDFRNSYTGGGASTIDSIGDRAWNTFKLGGAALIFAIATAVPLGVAATAAPPQALAWAEAYP